MTCDVCGVDLLASDHIEEVHTRMEITARIVAVKRDLPEGDRKRVLLGNLKDLRKRAPK